MKKNLFVMAIMVFGTSFAPVAVAEQDICTAWQSSAEQAGIQLATCLSPGGQFGYYRVKNTYGRTASFGVEMTSRDGKVDKMSFTLRPGEERQPACSCVKRGVTGWRLTRFRFEN